MNATSVSRILSDHVPQASYGYCFQLWKKFQFEFKLRKSRVTKVGDFTCYPGKVARITVNHDLDPYLFLITYLHEVAHLEVHINYSSRVESHGTEWKRSFQQMIMPVMNEEIFPPKLLSGLQKHMKNPKASTFSDSKFTQLLRTYDERQKHVVLLSQVPEGTVFGFQGKWFKKGKLRRTRVECKEIKTKLSYLVPADVPIHLGQLSLL